MGRLDTRPYAQSSHPPDVVVADELHVFDAAACAGCLERAQCLIHRSITDGVQRDVHAAAVSTGEQLHEGLVVVCLVAECVVFGVGVGLAAERGAGVE